MSSDGESDHSSDNDSCLGGSSHHIEIDYDSLNQDDISVKVHLIICKTVDIIKTY